MKMDPETGHVLARRYTTQFRSKCREYLQRQIPAIKQLCSNDKGFWRRFNARDVSLPATLAHHAPWQSFHTKLCVPPSQPMAPSPPAQPPPPSASAINGPILETEVLQALQSLHNSKVCGKDGWPAELLRYATYHAASDDGPPVKVWLLAPLLTAMLDALFQAGRAPTGKTSAFVMPIHKKGNDLDVGPYRPLAVGEPLYRLYTIILNKRIVDWSEQHGLRSPAQAGSRPQLSAAHHVFALRHFVDRARIRKVRLFACLVDIQKAYDTVQHGLLWERSAGLGVQGRMLAATQSMYAFGSLHEGWRHCWSSSGTSKWVSGRAVLSVPHCSASSLMACMSTSAVLMWHPCQKDVCFLLVAAP